MSEPMRFYVCTRAGGAEPLAGALLVMAGSADEAAAIFKESEAVLPSGVFRIDGARAGRSWAVLGRIGKAGKDGNGT